MARRLSHDEVTQQDVNLAFLPYIWGLDDPAVQNMRRKDPFPWLLEAAIEEAPGAGLTKSLFLAEPTFDEMRGLTEWANEEGVSLFFGVLPRIEPADLYWGETPVGLVHRRAKSELVTRGFAPCAWLDIDPSELAKSDDSTLEMWRRQRLMELKALDVPPTAVVSSGSGLHAYWRMIDDDENGWGWLSGFCVTVSKGLAKVLGGDPAVASPVGMLRVPGTYHRKAEPRRVDVVHLGEPVPVSLMKPFMEAGRRSNPKRQRRKWDLSTKRTAFCQRCSRNHAAWPPEDGARSALFKLSLSCAAHGWTEGEVIEFAQSKVDPGTDRPQRTPMAIEKQVRDVYARLGFGKIRPWNCFAQPRVVDGDDEHPAVSGSGRIVTLDEGRQVLSERISSFGREPRSLFISAPTGLGKTKALVDLLPEGPRGGANRIVYCAPTKEGVKEAVRPLRRLATRDIPRLLFGRIEERGRFHCAKSGRMERLAKKQRNTKAACRSCAVRASCDWMKSFKSFMACPIGAATQPAVASNPAVLEDAMVLVDENLCGMLARTFEIPHIDLRRYANEVETIGDDGHALSVIARSLAQAVEKREVIEGVELARSLEVELFDVHFCSSIGLLAPFPWEDELPDDEERCAPALTELMLGLTNLLRTNPENAPLHVKENALIVSLPNEPVLRAIREGRMLAADATAPVELVRRLGFQMEELRFDDTKALEVVGIAGKTFGAGSKDEVVRIARNFLRVGGAVVCRKAEAEALRKELPETADRILHYGAHRGTNALYEKGVTSLLVVRWMKNPVALRHEARIWATILGDKQPIPEVDLQGEGLGFPGTYWTRVRAGLPEHPILRAVVEQDRREVLQAIGRLRAQQQMKDEADWFRAEYGEEPDEHDLERLRVYILDGFPVPDVTYDEVLEGPGASAGGELEFYEELVRRNQHRGEAVDHLIAEVDQLWARREQVRQNRMEGVAAANAERQEAAAKRREFNVLKIKRYLRSHPDATNATIQNALGLSKWEVRTARNLMKVDATKRIWG